MISPGIGDSSPCRPIEVALTRIRVLDSSASMIDSCQGIALSSMWAALLPKNLTSASARWRWRLKTMIRRKPAVIRPWITARLPPPAPKTTAWRGIFWRPTSLSIACLKPGTSVLWPTRRLPSRVIVLTAPGRMGVLGQPIDQRHDPLLVGDRHVGAQEVIRAQLGDRVGQGDRGSIPELVAGVDPERIEGGLLHRAGQRMADRMADQDDALRHARTPSSTAKKPG